MTFRLEVLHLFTRLNLHRAKKGYRRITVGVRVMGWFGVRVRLWVGVRVRVCVGVRVRVGCK